MSPIDQPLMPMELLGCRSPAPAHNVARRILASTLVGRVQLLRHHRLRQRRLQPDRRRRTELHEREELQQLCRQRLDAFREQRGEEVFARRSPITGSVTTGRLRRHQKPAGALLPRCAGQQGHREAGCVFCALELITGRMAGIA
ncbi:hypothetical protein [Cyanobium sp. LEGE 06113]|uniref:hypothetical protein n=1 Tax=Cyanobium sp. LEGE 06113 TaxID=1297573 RepID=UPI001881A170|nr:hypothetical protein [Cyanobium sp. LEGE 06113]